MSPRKKLRNTIYFSPVPEKYWDIIANGDVSASFYYNDNYVQLGRSFTSALGFECRQLFIRKNGIEGSTSTESNKRITCKNPSESSWVAVPAIVASKRSTSLFN